MMAGTSADRQWVEVAVRLAVSRHMASRPVITLGLASSPCALAGSSVAIACGCARVCALPLTEWGSGPIPGIDPSAPKAA